MSSRFNPAGTAAASSQHLWNAPVSDVTRAQQQQQQEEQFRRSQEQQYYEQQAQQYGADGQQYQEPVDYDIYHKAVAVSSPRLAGQSGNVDPDATIRKTILRRVEVPFTRSVQVPTQVVQIVPTTVEQRIPVRKLVQTPGFQTVNESYVEYEDREAIREKEVWVKKIVPERYVERVPVQKVRQVQKATSVIREVESWETVAVPTTRRMVTQGFKTEEVPDSRVVEVEEEQTFSLRPEPVGPNEIVSTRDIGRLQNQHSHLPDAPYGTPSTNGVPLSQAGVRGVPSYGRSGVYNGASVGASIVANNGSTSQFGSSQGYNRPGAAAGGAVPFGQQANPLEALRAHGLGVDESHTRHTDGTGVVVTRIERGGGAARAGLQVGDIITAIQGRPTQSVAEFVQLLQRAPGQVTFNVNRDGRRNIALAFSK